MLYFTAMSEPQSFRDFKINHLDRMKEMREMFYRGMIAGTWLVQGGLKLPAERGGPHTTSALHCTQEIGAEVFRERRRVIPSLSPGWAVAVGKYCQVVLAGQLPE